MRVVIFAGMTLIGATIGAAMASPIEASDGSYIVIVLGCAMVGFVAAEVLLRLIGSKPRRRRKPHVARPRPNHHPQPFQSRLARFADRDETEVMVDSATHRSTMPFWSAWKESRSTPPKPARFIRRILERIRRLVRG